jgi:hypothetical protein
MHEDRNDSLSTSLPIEAHESKADKLPFPLPQSLSENGIIFMTKVVIYL